MNQKISRILLSVVVFAAVLFAAASNPRPVAACGTGGGCGGSIGILRSFSE